MAPISVGHYRILKVVCAAPGITEPPPHCVFRQIAHLGRYDRRAPEMARRRSGSTGGPFGRTTPRPCDSEFRRHWSLWLRHQEQQRGPRRRKGIGTAFRSWCSRIRPGWRDPCSKRRPDPFGTSAEAGATGDPWRWRGSAFQADACAQLVQKARVIAEYKRQFRCDRFQDAPPFQRLNGTKANWTF